MGVGMQEQFFEISHELNDIFGQYPWTHITDPFGGECFEIARATCETTCGISPLIVCEPWPQAMLLLHQKANPSE
jgi:hypothetical protein